MTQMRQMTTDYTSLIYIRQICENLFNQCHLRAILYFDTPRAKTE